ncbi:hypothetical protein Q9251_08160 [Alkalihalobacillus macyae]|uniref:hypothetical protein n=1 Tax=Guptibacillus hwajinpoensis TaxID=208199 RepID=UPI00273B725D|nr:hypothetical protein [Alkalihalobacillus macyae]MDP4550856.1 hypothetical protein [Alkalihalobacillus macyae]
MRDYYKHIYEGGFVKYPNEIGLYTILGHADKKKDREPWMEAEKTYEDYCVTSASLDVYRSLFQHRNTNSEHAHFEKAWPAQRSLQLELAMSDGTLRKHIKILERVGLLDVFRTHKFRKPFHIYSFPTPLSIEDFRSRFPVACKKYEEAMKILEKIREEEAEIYGMPQKEDEIDAMIGRL